MRSKTLAAFVQIEEQLAEERANALSRIGRRLEMLLRSLDELADRCRQETGAARERAVAAYREGHEQARLYRWYLEVQREALGLRGHDAVDRVFPLPPRVPPSGPPAATS